MATEALKAAEALTARWHDAYELRVHTLPRELRRTMKGVRAAATRFANSSSPEEEAQVRRVAGSKRRTERNGR